MSHVYLAKEIHYYLWRRNLDAFRTVKQNLLCEMVGGEKESDVISDGRWGEGEGGLRSEGGEC